MSEETKDTEQQPTNSTPEENGGTGEERTFTQEEVNKIVSERLAREREKGTPSEAEQREKALTAREAAISCKEYISEKGYPAGLLEVLDTSDAEKFKAAVKKLVKICPDIDPATRSKTPIVTRGTQGGTSPERDRLREAFRLN